MEEGSPLVQESSSIEADTSTLPDPIPEDWKQGRAERAEEWFQSARDDTQRSDTTCLIYVESQHVAAQCHAQLTLRRRFKKDQEDQEASKIAALKAQEEEKARACDLQAFNQFHARAG